MSETLKPCPFCGNPANHTPRIQGPKEHGPGAVWPETVSCLSCRITFRSGENGVGDAVEKWNTRANDNRWRSVAEQAETALRFYADVSKYPVPKTGGLGELYFDCGDTAKTALAAFGSLRKEGK